MATREPQRQIILFLDHTAKLSGGEIALWHLVRMLDRERYEPVVVLFSDGPLVEKLEEEEVETHILPLKSSVVVAKKDQLGKSTLLRVKDMSASFNFCLALVKFMKKRGVDVVHTNSLKADVLGGFAARLARIPVIWHVRDRIADDYLPPKASKVFRWLCRTVPDFVIANSQATLDTLQLPPQRTLSRTAVIYGGTVVHDGIPDTELGPRRISSSAPVIGMVGRISPWKGQHIFLDAAAIVQKYFPSARFRIVGAPLFGEDEYETEVRKQSESLGLADCVEWLGFRDDVNQCIEEFDVLVHASTVGEPFGQVIIQGMIAGKPVVATRGGGTVEIVQEAVTGRLVPMSNPEAMAEAIVQIINDPQAARRMGVAGRKRVQDNFTIEMTARRVEEVYCSLKQRLEK